MAEIKYVDWDGLVYYHKKVTQYIDDKFNDQVDPCLKFGGIFNLENVPFPGLDTLNYIYKIDEDFSVSPENPLFVQTALNHKYNAGTIIQVIEADKDIYLFDILFEVISQTAITPEGEVDLSNYYTKDQVEALIKDLPTKEYVDNAIKNITIDTSNLATKEELSAVEEKIPSLEGYAKKSDIPEVPTKVSELENDAGYVTASDIPETDLSNYYNKTETENLIAEAVKDIEHPTVDLEGYATEAWVNEQGFIKEVPSEYITESELDAKGYLTEHQDLSDYAKKSDIPQPELFVVDYNAPDFAAAKEAYNNGKLLLLTNAAPDANGYAVMNYVREDLITFTKFLMSRSETYGAFNTYYLHSDNTWEIAKEVKLNKVDAVVDDNNDITGLTIGKNTYEFDNFATTEVVNQINQNIENIENTYVSTDVLEQKNYVTNDYIEQQNYVTNTTLEEKEYITTSEATTKIEQIVEEKVTEAVTPDSINYATWE